MSKTEYSVYEVFTPTTRARANFVPRSSVNDRLVAAIQTPGKQVIVYGESGSGKSTLLQRKLEELYPQHITTRCSAATTWEGLLLDAFDQLEPFYTAAHREEVTARYGSGISADYLGLKAEISASRERTNDREDKRVLPPQLTVQRLGQFLGVRGLCWVLEDFHKVPAEAKTPLSQALKIFSDMAGDFSSLKVIALGATETARQVVAYDNEMRNRVAEVLVPLMTDDELGSIILGGQILLNLNLSAVRPAFVRYSMGVAAVCHQLALNACLNAGVERTEVTTMTLGPDAIRPALARWVDESSDSLKATFDRALKRHKVRRFDNTRLIMRALARGRLDGLMYGDILKSIREFDAHDYPGGNLTQYLRQLMETDRGSLILATTDGRYRFVDPLHHTYAQAALLDTRDATAGNIKYVLTNQLLTYAADWQIIIPTTGYASTGYVFGQELPVSGMTLEVPLWPATQTGESEDE